MNIRASVAAAAVLLGCSGAVGAPALAQGQCPNGDPPCITSLTERGGFITVHWSGNRRFDHYNIRSDGTQIEAPGTNRNQLYNRRSIAFPGRFVIDNKKSFVIQGCEKPLVGGSRCTAWSQPVSIWIEGGKVRACRQYANTAIGTLNHARRFAGCSAAVLRGPRWTASFEEHFEWCMRAPQSDRESETRARTQIMHRCRINRDEGAANLRVAKPQRGDTYEVSGTGFSVNAPVVIRVTGPASLNNAITVVAGQRIVADRNGAFAVRIPSIMLCARAGRIELSAESGERRTRAPVATTCSP